MIRNILGVVVGYISMFIFIFISFTALYLIIGAEGAFEPDTYQVSVVWIIISFVLSIIAALFGGYICKLISKNRKAVYTLAGIVLVLGVIFAIPALSNSNDEVHEIRNADVPNMEAMQKAKQPPFVALLNPLIGAIGVIAGGRLKKFE